MDQTHAGVCKFNLAFVSFCSNGAGSTTMGSEPAVSRQAGTTSMHARHQAEAPEVRVVVLQVGRQDSCRMDGAPVAVQPAPTRARVPRLRCSDLVPRRRRVLHHPSRDPSDPSTGDGLIHGGAVFVCPCEEGHGRPAVAVCASVRGGTEATHRPCFGRELLRFFLFFFLFLFFRLAS